MEATENEAAEAASFFVTSDECRGLLPDTLLMLGSDSPKFIRGSISYPAERLPRARLVLLWGQGHAALAESPEVLASALKNFFEGM